MKPILSTISLLLLFSVLAFAQGSDTALRTYISDDTASRSQTGKLAELSAAEHLRRAEVYSTNRMFPQAREHWKNVLERFPNDPGVPHALFGTARSYMWERDYPEAVRWFEKLTAAYPETKDGREGLAYMGASLVRQGKNLDAAKVYQRYTVMFPQGEKIDSAHLNIIDAYREAKKYEDAETWVETTVRKFDGQPTEVNALQAKVRMEIYRQAWPSAIEAADRLLSGHTFSGSMTSADEIRYLRAYALERSGKTAEARAAFASLAYNTNSYYGAIAAQRTRPEGSDLPAGSSSASVSAYPVMFRDILLRHARKNKIDPRFLLAIMKQESSFRANAKSPAGARGLLQLVFDTALKYNKKAGYPDLHPDDLYSPEVNIAIGATYAGELKDQFDGLYEAVAASYNGGEDNVARWLARTKPKLPEIFASEVGFAESKAYVFKVMNNYRAYRQLYTEQLVRR